MPSTRQDWEITTDDGVRLVGDDQGRPGGRPIVLLHGLSSNQRWWDPVAARLAPWHRVVRYDQRGHGRSTDGPRGGYTVDRLVGDTWATASPRMVGDRRAPTSEAVLAAYLAGEGTLPREALPAVLGNYTADGHGYLWPRPPREACQQLAHSLWRRDPIRALVAVDVPVLVLAAQSVESTLRQPRHESIRRARAQLGDRVRVQWVVGGHDLPLEQPAMVAEALSDLAASTEILA